GLAVLTCPRGRCERSLSSALLILSRLLTRKRQRFTHRGPPLRQLPMSSSADDTGRANEKGHAGIRPRMAFFIGWCGQRGSSPGVARVGYQIYYICRSRDKETATHLMRTLSSGIQSESSGRLGRVATVAVKRPTPRCCCSKQ